MRFALGGAAIGATGFVFYSLLNTFFPSVLANDSSAALKFFLLGAVVVFSLAGAVIGRVREDDEGKKKEIIRRNRELSAINSISMIISKSKDPEKMLGDALREVLNLHFLSVVRRGVIFIVEKEGSRTLRMAASVNLHDALLKEETVIRFGHCLCGKAAAEGKSLISLNCMKDPSHTVHYPGMKPHGHIIIPIKSEGIVLGIMTFYTPPDVLPSPSDLRLLKGVARQLAVALKNTKLINELESLSMNITHALSSAIDAKSPWTKGHSERVAEYAASIAEKLGMEPRFIERIRLAGLLHDIGKIGTYDALLDKTEKLTPEERELIKQHPDRGCEILAPINDMDDILPAVRHHHERWDGGGYPAGLKGTEIPLMARALCIADSFDTMTEDRPYRPSIGIDNAIQELKYCAGSQFDPELVEIFLEVCRTKGIPSGKKDEEVVCSCLLPEVPLEMSEVYAEQEVED
ncbi:MAG: HD domain-containing phosphohydrolase [Nitrospirota bacterium]